MTGGAALAEHLAGFGAPPSRQGKILVGILLAAGLY